MIFFICVILLYFNYFHDLYSIEFFFFTYFSGKLLWELIQPCTQRINGVKEFLEDVDSSIEYNVVPITDMYGPTKEDPSLEMLVVSQETQRGGDKVNELRLQKDLSKLDIHVVELAADECHNNHEEEKISSSNHRIRLLGTRLQPPVSYFFFQKI